MTKTKRAPQKSFSTRTSRIIGRKDILESIQKALVDKSGTSQVIYLEAIGGMGKTRILEEVGNIQKKAKGEKFLWSDKIDLYHEKNHSPDNLQKAIATGLDPKNTQFKKFHLVQKELEDKQSQGFGGPAIEGLRHKVNEQFIEDYRILAKKKRVALCFDTMELTQHESDIVQQICQVENEDTVARNWILDFVGQAPNTVTIFAGRPQARIKKDDFGSDHNFVFQNPPINEFNEEESLEYLNERIKQNPSLAEILTEDVKKWITQIAGGRPIRLALCVDLLFVRGDGALPTSAEHIDQELIYKLFIDPETPPIFRYLIVARKGLDEGLFLHLMGGSKEKIKESFASLNGLEIVKKPEGSKRYFLHDEIYDLADRYFKDEAWFGENYNSIVQYYDSLRESAAPDARKDMTVELLYYEHQRNARDGYHKYYARWDEEAIASHETGFDMRLRDEGLHFMDRYTNLKSDFYSHRVDDTVVRAEIDRDCAVRWVKRYVARGQFEKAVQIANNIRYSTHPHFDWNVISDPIYKAGLLTAWAGALTYYTGALENDIREMLNEAIRYLDNNKGMSDDKQWWRARILGAAYNQLGYLHRSQGRYGLALEQYKHALPLFSDEGIQDERANTLNNMAFLLALLGRVRLARTHIDQALEIRTRLGREYPIALSMNTRGLIHVLEDHPMWGERECKAALQMCQKMGDPRGIGLAQMGLGLALRKKGNQWKMDVGYSQMDAEKLFREAEEYFRSSSEIFSKSVYEPIRLWEAYNELGSLYCDWAWLTRKRLDEGWKQQALDQYDRSIVHQEDALKVAIERNLSFQVADSYDDLAQAYADRSFMLSDIGRRNEALEGLVGASTHLEKILETIPLEYHLVAGKGFQPGPEPGEAYWLSLGKYYLQRGIWIFEQVKRELLPRSEENLRDGIRFFALSNAYFHQYWPQSYAFETGLNACAARIQRAGVSAPVARTIVEEVAREYAVNLDPLLEAIESVLGI